MPDPDQARSVLVQIVTAARNSDMDLATRLTAEYDAIHGDILPLFITAVTMIETVLLSVAESVGMPADKLWQGIALGLSVKEIERKKNQQ